ncbi:hypothetical protein D3C73_416770 [compost metagenome]
MDQGDRFGDELRLVIDAAQDRNDVSAKAADNFDVEAKRDLRAGERDQAFDDNHVMIGAQGFRHCCYVFKQSCEVTLADLFFRLLERDRFRRVGHAQGAGEVARRIDALLLDAAFRPWLSDRLDEGDLHAVSLQCPHQAKRERGQADVLCCRSKENYTCAH